jgi:hypothetical protein
MCRALEKSNFAPRGAVWGRAGCKLNESRKLSAALERPNLTHFFIPFLRVRQSAFHLPLDLFTCTRSFNSAALFKTLSRDFPPRALRVACATGKGTTKKGAISLIPRKLLRHFSPAESFSRAAACSYFLCVRVALNGLSFYYKMYVCVCRKGPRAHLHPSTRINCLTNEAASSYLG